MLNKPRKGGNGAFKVIISVLSLGAINELELFTLFTCLSTHAPGEASLSSSNLFSEYTKSFATTFLSLFQVKASSDVKNTSFRR